MKAVKINPQFKALQQTRKPKKKYKKSDALYQLEKLEFAHNYEGRTIPDYAKVKTKYTDKTANGLTKAILAYLKIKGAFATRLNSTGLYRQDLGRYVHSNQRKGMADILATFNGLSIQIEVKIGRDRMSEHQKKIQSEHEAAGGLYFVARDFESFMKWFDEIMESISNNVEPSKL